MDKTLRSWKLSRKILWEAVRNQKINQSKTIFLQLIIININSSFHFQNYKVNEVLAFVYVSRSVWRWWWLIALKHNVHQLRHCMSGIGGVLCADGTRYQVLLRGTIVNTRYLVGPMVYIKNYILNHFYNEYLVLLTMVPRNITIINNNRGTYTFVLCTKNPEFLLFSCLLAVWERRTRTWHA